MRPRRLADVGGRALNFTVRQLAAMHAVPDTFSLEHLLGRTLTAVSFGPYDLHFLFAPKDDILCVGTVVLEVDGERTTVMDRAKLQDVNILRSVPGHEVIGWRIEGSHEFSITLSNGAKLRFISEDSRREDFVVFPGVQVF